MLLTLAEVSSIALVVSSRTSDMPPDEPMAAIAPMSRSKAYSPGPVKCLLGKQTTIFFKNREGVAISWKP